jgi:hypothetical protein
MNTEDNNTPQYYTFHIQSAEDFYRQLHQQITQDWADEQNADVEDTALAKNMLKSIGVKV